ncbi:MAG TPA: DUF1003 domain-containing protein [Alphaproteobacteria bacterium]|nr:DUF1003 domain-containing protein [Alphaproteobacteria bacterium]
MAKNIPAKVKNLRANPKRAMAKKIEPHSERRGKRVACAVSGKLTDPHQLHTLESLRPALAAALQADFPDLGRGSKISDSVLARYRVRQVQDMLRQERGELGDLDREVAESIATHETISENPEDEFEDQRTFGEKLADHIAAFGGSWKFLISFASFLGLWILGNVWFLQGEIFDPYPFILLNLILSCLAAVQAPIIMMSQNRSEAKDRLRNENDYRINLKAELEIRLLHEKLDHLIAKQWERLTEIQQIQTELLHDLTRQRR